VCGREYEHRARPAFTAVLVSPHTVERRSEPGMAHRDAHSVDDVWVVGFLLLNGISEALIQPYSHSRRKQRAEGLSNG
jgi:hypothetical protein